MWILPPGQYVLVAHVVRPLVEYPGPTLYADRVAVTEMGVQLWTVTAALIIATLEVSVFIKYDLWMDMHIHTSCSRCCCCSWIFKSDNVRPPTFPKRSMFGPHTNFWAPFLYPTFYIDIIAYSLGPDLYMQCMWAHWNALPGASLLF